jgi:cell wall-associated NlpC family hydrolase
MTTSISLQPGDLLYRSKGPVQHAGIYMGNNLVLHHRPVEGVALTDYAEYASGRKVKVVNTKAGNTTLLTERLSDLLASNPKYNLLLNNCEHIAHLMIAGRKFSPQIQATILGAISGLVMGHKTKKGYWALFLIGGGLAGCLLKNVGRKYHAVIQAG